MIASRFWFPLATMIATFASIQLLPGAELDPARSRLGINLSGVADWSTEHPFVDVFRFSRAWISQRIPSLQFF